VAFLSYQNVVDLIHLATRVHLAQAYQEYVAMPRLDYSGRGTSFKFIFKGWILPVNIDDSNPWGWIMIRCK